MNRPKTAAVAVANLDTAQQWEPTLDRLVADESIDEVFIFVPDMKIIRNRPGLTRLIGRGISANVEVVLERGYEAILFLGEPVLTPPNVALRAVEFVSRDPRIACVSFLSNSADHLSIPFRNKPTLNPVAGHDETSATLRLRQEPDSGPVPIPIPAGVAFVLSRACLRAVGGLDDLIDDGSALSAIDFGLAAQRRGFRSVLDAGTYVHYQADLARWPYSPLADSSVRARLTARYSYFQGVYRDEAVSNTSPLACALSAARAKLFGVRVAIDASCLGPFEMGTQVQAVALINALARNRGVQHITVATGVSGLPRYAHSILASSKVKVVPCEKLDMTPIARVDVIHRPFQPDEAIPWRVWHKRADRVIITIQDLIAYDNAAYHIAAPRWLSYRRALTDAVSMADGVVAISNDVSTAMDCARLDVPPSRVRVIEQGTDHLTGSEEGAMPQQLADRQEVASAFVLVLGATYAHKNRDIAIRAVGELQRRGHAISLVLAGVTVATGSTHREESLALAESGARDTIVLPDVTSEERNWLMRHAVAVLYPTSAEGFGLVPFEAARFGTPTVHVSFGPLAEVLRPSPATTDSWDPVHIADALERIVRDPTVGARCVADVLSAENVLTWDRTASRLVSFYLESLAAPKRHEMIRVRPKSAPSKMSVRALRKLKLTKKRPG